MTPLEQPFVDSVWKHPECAAEMCRAGASGQTHLKESTPSIPSGVHEAGRQLIDRFCGGSVKELLVGIVDIR